jgi:hypothetical protein
LRQRLKQTEETVKILEAELRSVKEERKFLIDREERQLEAHQAELLAEREKSDREHMEYIKN